MDASAKPASAAELEQHSAAALQELVPSYDVLELLGRGGMGAVYKVRQRSLNRLVALKILPPVPADDEFHYVERFRQEARTMAQLNHPAIVHVHDFSETPAGRLYFVMEYVEGTDVQRLLEAEGRLSCERAIGITMRVCEALEYAHARGVIHRDIKPSNVLIDHEGQVKVADFGVAKLAGLDPMLTGSNVALGTPNYAAPESLTAGMTVDHRADVYAAGVMLYQMLTGAVPRGLFKLPSQKSGCDPRLDAIVCKALETDATDRYQTARELRDELQMIQAAAPVSAACVERAALVERTPARRLLFALAGIAILGGAAVYFALPRKNGPERAEPRAEAREIETSRLKTVSDQRNSATPASAAADAGWTDWLSSKLADNYYFSTEGGWKREAGGLTTFREIVGEAAMPPTTKNGAIRITYELRDSNGPQITVRSRGTGEARELYGVQDDGGKLSIFREDPNPNTVRFLATRPVPPGVSRTLERTLEFRFVGDTLTATLNRTVSITAKDERLTEGLCAIVLTKDVLLKKVEIRDLPD